MMYEDQTVGEIQLPPGAPTWLIQLTGSVASVDRKEFLAGIEAVAAQVRRAGRDAALARARDLVAQFNLKPRDVFASTRGRRNKT